MDCCVVAPDDLFIGPINSGFDQEQSICGRPLLLGLTQRSEREDDRHLELKSPSWRVFSEQQAIDLLVSLTASDANSEKKWRGFYNSLTSTELRQEWDDHWS